MSILSIPPSYGVLKANICSEDVSSCLNAVEELSISLATSSSCALSVRQVWRVRRILARRCCFLFYDWVDQGPCWEFTRQVCAQVFAFAAPQILVAAWSQRCPAGLLPPLGAWQWGHLDTLEARRAHSSASALLTGGSARPDAQTSASDVVFSSLVFRIHRISPGKQN